MNTKRMIAIPLSIVILYAASVPLNFYFRSNVIRTDQERDIIQRIFGGLRGFIGDWAFMKAEEYHHRGLGFLEAEAYHEGEGFAVEEVHHEHGAAENKTLYSKIYSGVKVTKDSHLKPAEEKEVLPWFYVETAFDPRDIRGYVLGAYWLQRLNKPFDAMEFLKNGLKNNPASASILGSIGHLYYNENRPDMALDYLERAKDLWLKGAPPNEASDKYSKSDRFFSLDLLGAIYEKTGQNKKAVDIYRQLYKLEPNRIISEKIERLEK